MKETSDLLVRFTRWMNRRAVLLFGLAGALALGPWVNSKAPDIVVYLSDDHSQFDSSLYGAADIPTPQFEKLASEGMTFSHAFVASPSCAPSRAALFTGLMPARNGAEDNHSFPRKGIHWLVKDLQDSGYEVVAFGKVAHGQGVERVGFDQFKAASSYQAVKEAVGSFLEKWQSEKPLCLFAGVSNPHVPWPKESSFDPKSVVFPPHHLDTPSTRLHRAAYYEEIKELDKLLGEIRDMAQARLGPDYLFIHTSDHGAQWPFGKWNLYDYGIRVPFLVSWPSVVRAGSRSDAMIQWIDVLPTLIESVGGTVPPGLDGRSFLNILKGESFSHRDRIFTTHSGDRGMNVYPIRSIRTREWKLIHNLHPEFAFTNHSDLLRKPGAGAYWGEWVELADLDDRARMIVNRYYQRPEWELYHVASDRWEQKNLAEDPGQSERLATLKRELAQWMNEQGDKESVFAEPRRLDHPETWRPDRVEIPDPGEWK